MSDLLHHSSSVGSLVKKIVAVNPDLNVRDIADIIRQSSTVVSGIAGEFGTVTEINESEVLRKAREIVKEPIRLSPRPSA